MVNTNRPQSQQIFAWKPIFVKEIVEVWRDRENSPRCFENTPSKIRKLFTQLSIKILQSSDG
jgi:hypothetical protein